MAGGDGEGRVQVTLSDSASRVVTEGPVPKLLKVNPKAPASTVSTRVAKSRGAGSILTKVGLGIPSSNISGGTNQKLLSTPSGLTSSSQFKHQIQSQPQSKTSGQNFSKKLTGLARVLAPSPMCSPRVPDPNSTASNAGAGAAPSSSSSSSESNSKRLLLNLAAPRNFLTSTSSKSLQLQTA